MIYTRQFTVEEEILKLNNNIYKVLLDNWEGVGKKLKEKDVDPEQLAMGIKVEMEHTTNKDIAKKIALDHLYELDDYYTRLAEMERQGKEDKKK